MRFIVIPADSDQPIEEVEREGSTLDALQECVGGFIEVVDPFDRYDVTGYGNEEGKFALARNDRATVLCAPVMFADDYFAGPMVLAGFDPSEGSTVDLPDDVTPAWVDEQIAAVAGKPINTPSLAEHAAANPDAIVVDGTVEAPPLYAPES